MAEEPNLAEHRAMAWATIGTVSVAIGATAGTALGVWGASSHLWGDGYFLAGFVAACALTMIGIYALVAEFIGGLPLPPTRHEREQRQHSRRPTITEPPYRTEATVTHRRDKADGGEGGSGTADESGIAYLLKRSQETFVGAVESAEVAGRLLRAQDAPTPRAQPVSDAHRDLLKEVAHKLRSYVDASQHAYYGAQGDERKAQAFEEHFPDVAGRVTAWNKQIAVLETERRELQEWVEGRLRALAYDQPPFAWGYVGLIADLAAVDGAELPFHVPQIQPLWLQLGPYPLVPDPPGNGRTREAVEDELRGVLSETRQQPQCERIRQIRGSLAEASEPLISDLDLIQAKDVINGLGDCLLCR